MFADDERSTIYVTTDEGETFSTYNVPVDPRTLKIHPTMPGWILGHDPNQVCYSSKVENFAYIFYIHT